MTSKRVGLWLVVVIGPALMALVLFGPRPFGFSDYLILAFYPFLTLHAVWRLVTERPRRA